MTATMLRYPTWTSLRAAIAVSIGCVLSAATSALAQTSYPTKSVRIVAPFAPGASTDLVARMLATKLTELNGQQFFVDNKTGANGDIGNDFVARSAPDGYTLLFASGSIVLAAAFKASLPYSPTRDFVPVAMVSSYPQFLVTHPGIGATDLKSFVAKIKATPDAKHFYTSSGLGGIQHAVAAGFLHVAGISMNHVPYAGGAPAQMEIMAGRASLGTAAPTSLQANLDSGKMIALAVAGSERNRFFPNVPTVAEAGFPEFSKLSSWSTLQIVLAPKGTPPEIVAKLNKQVNEFLADPATIKKFTEFGQDNLVGSTPESTKAFFEKEQADWNKLAKELNIKLE